VRIRIQNLFLLPALMAGLGLFSAVQVTAQTFTNLHSFPTVSGSFPYTNSDGANPQAGLVLSGNTLFGTASMGGTNGTGTVFAISNGTFNLLRTFSALDQNTLTNTDGANPNGGLLLAGTNLYGTTYYGGTNGNGAIFSISTNGVLKRLYSFTALDPNIGTNKDGANPNGGLLLAGSNLYGTTYYGGTNDNGAIFSISTNGAFNRLYSFTALDPIAGTNKDGANPNGGLIFSSNRLYGTAAAGGSGGVGTVFAVNTNGTGFTNLHNFTATSGPLFTNSDGANPAVGLVMSGNTLYGTTSSGGNSGNGIVFAVNTNGTGFTNLHSFTATSGSLSTNSDGANPGALILSGNTLYGTTQFGGGSGNGTVFAVNTDGTGFTTLYNFTVTSGPLSTNSDGANPATGLILSGTALYGAALNGGASGNGTVFKLVPPAPILSPQLSAGNFLLSFQAFAGASYTVQQNTNLAGTNWIAFTNILGSGTVTQLTLPTTNAAQLFFRVRQP
jgi:uncharacterized repeat protein (TIGR03803 family)